MDSARPKTPYNSPKIKISETWIVTKIIDPINTVIIFWFPINSDKYIEEIVFGIIAMLRIWIINTASKNFGNKYGIMMGARKIPSKAKIPDAKHVNFFNFELVFPIASCGSV